jgi:AAA+ ATPase superfamily predicted ATPase
VRKNGKREVFDIDVLALNEKTKEILFVECKWQNKVNARKICKELKEKAKYVQWHNSERKESFAIFAKSFRRKIDEFEGKKVYCFDLRDLERVLKTGKNLK